MYSKQFFFNKLTLFSFPHLFLRTYNYIPDTFHSFTTLTTFNKSKPNKNYKLTFELMLFKTVQLEKLLFIYSYLFTKCDPFADD